MENTKVCKKCLIEKTFDGFYKNPKGKEGYRPICKECHLDSGKKYNIENSESLKEYKKQYRLKNKEFILMKEKEKRDTLTSDEKKLKSLYQKEWRENNIDKMKEYDKNYYIKNKELILSRVSNYRYENKDKIKDYLSNYKPIRNEKRNQRLKTDIIFLLEKKIRNYIYESFKYNGYKKTSKTSDILGCSFEEFKLYLESKFEPWMNWENRGLYNGDLNYGWDIDHIIPISTAKTIEDVINLNHYTNLQPLCSYINRCVKRDSINT